MAHPPQVQPGFRSLRRPQHSSRQWLKGWFRPPAWRVDAAKLQRRETRVRQLQERRSISRATIMAWQPLSSSARGAATDTQNREPRRSFARPVAGASTLGRSQPLVA